MRYTGREKEFAMVDKSVVQSSNCTLAQLNPMFLRMLQLSKSSAIYAHIIQ
jgi:hypothetical protein